MAPRDLRAGGAGAEVLATSEDMIAADVDGCVCGRGRYLYDDEEEKKLVAIMA